MTPPQPLLIFPCNGNGLEALDCVGPGYRTIGFIDDTTEKVGSLRFGFPVYGREALQRFPQAAVLAVPGSPSSFRQRQAVVESLGVNDSRFARVVHPLACISSQASVGFNVLVMAGVVITSNTVIGNHVCLLPNTVVHHDAVVGAWTLVGSNVTIAGQVTVGRNCYLGSGSTMKNGITVEDEVLVGLGSNVLHDVPPAVTVVGNPARILYTTSAVSS
jgi:sugar O-acyltransferase (sialic acid O-acetyltransferase NeuD family)